MNNELIKLTEAELEDLVTSWGYPRFRAKQIHEWVHRHHAASFDAMSNLPKDLRAKLSEFFPLEMVKIWLFGGFCGRDSGIGPAQRAKTTIWN